MSYADGTFMAVPFNRIQTLGDESRHIERALADSHLMGDGGFTRRCQSLLERVLGADAVLLTTSCTHALEIAAMLLDLQPGDEVIVPSFTFVSTANAFALRGARPVFADIRPDTLNLDETRVESLITPRTRAVVPVHYAGVACAMERLTDLASTHGLTVIEDNAHGLFGGYQGKPLGTWGAMATLSFHETKNFSCGEGGALILNEARLRERAEIIREKGTNRNKFFRGEVDRYTWVELGSSYVMSDLLAAFLYGQLEVRERVQSRRRELWSSYQAELREWADLHGVGQPQPPADCAPAWHMYSLIMPSLEVRSAFIAHLKAAEIQAVFHYSPLHLSGMGRRFGGRPGDCPVAEDISDRLVRLPFFNSMTDAEQRAVIERVLSFHP